MCSIDRLCPVMDNGQSCCQPADCTFCMYYYENNSDELEKYKGCQINLKPKTSIKNRWDNFVTIWLDNDFYEKYKDSQGLKGIRKEIKHNDRI